MRQRSGRAIMVPLATLAIVLAAGCSKEPNDAAIVTNIKSQMFSDSQLKDSNLQVKASNGQVTLTGTVPTDGARLEAYKIAAQTAGVAKVSDQMVVQQAAAPAPAETAAQIPVEPVPVAPPPIKPEPKPKHERTKKPRPEVADAAPIPPEQSPEPDVTPPRVAAPEPAAAPAVVASLPPTPPPPALQDVVVPANTNITVRMIDGVSTNTDQAGEIFHASLENPLVINNEVIVPKGADVYVRLISASKARRFKGKSELTLGLVKLEYQGRAYPLVSSTYSTSGASQGKATGEKVGGGAALGAIIGAIAGGGKGAAIGAAAGAGGGGVYQGIGKQKEVTVPSETKLDFQLEQPVTISVMPRAPSAQ